MPGGGSYCAVYGCSNRSETNYYDLLSLRTRLYNQY